MDTVKFEKGEARVVAHRGLSGIETENTNAAFVAAGNRTYYGIETDIHRTADGRFVVCHDFDLVRVAGENIRVEDTTLDELLSIALFDKDGTKSRGDLRLTTLENYVSICKKYGKHCVLELKSDFTDEDIVNIVEIIKGYEYLDRVTFISFEFENLVKIRKLLPEQSVQSLFGKNVDFNTQRAIEAKMDVDVDYRSLTEEIIKRVHEAGLKVNSWTVDKKEDAERLALWGVDYITTNILE